MATPVFFSGQLHPVNGSLQGKIRFEKQMFHYMLEAGDIGNVATFCQCLPSFLTAKPERVHASSFSDAVREALSDPETSLTIKTYMRCNLNASLTAKRLFIHRNSLQYRIDKFIERTAIDIRQFEEAYRCLFDDASPLAASAICTKRNCAPCPFTPPCRFL